MSSGLISHAIHITDTMRLDTILIPSYFAEDISDATQIPHPA